MATANNQGVIVLDADGSDEIKNYPNTQRNNASRLSDALRVTYGSMTLDKALSESYCAINKAGKILTMTVFFKTGSFTQQPEIFPTLLSLKMRPMGAYYAPLTGVTDDGRAVATILKITTDGNITHLQKTPLFQNSMYTGNFTWVTADY